LPCLVPSTKRVRQTGISLVWIEHIMHALVAVVDRIVVLAGGAIIADDKPHAVVQNPRVAEIYMGIPAND